jgi:hypothetical protein
MNKHIYLLLIAMLPTFAWSQTLTDGLMMPKKNLCTGFIFSHDQWTDYWEGKLNRDNANIGTIKTQSLMWMGTYGITDKINVIASLPYVWTKATGGTLRGMEGLQDITLGVKYNFFTNKTDKTTLKFFGALAYSMPVTDYAPDYLPLAIGSGSKRLQWRLNTYFRLEQGFFAAVSGGYTWRSNVELDRPSHYYNGELVNSHEAYLPNIVDLMASVGYHKGPIQAQLDYMEMYTLKGDDIGRQGMPEVGNQMNFKKVGATVMYYLPAPKGLAVRAAGSITVDGRNVGESTTFMGGVMYTIHFGKKKTDTESTQQ